MPMQPSTQVTHMPEAGTIEPSVRFLVSVAAEVLTRENVAIMGMGLLGTQWPSRISHATQGSM